MSVGKMKRYTVVATLITISLVGCGSEPPVNIELGEGFLFSPIVKITSVADEVTVNSIKLNRGNCKPNNSYDTLPQKLTFGKSLNIGFIGCQNLLEVSLETSQGDFDFSFEQ